MNDLNYEPARLAPSHPAHPVLTGEQLLEAVREVVLAIEHCGASVELTNAVSKASDLHHHVRRYVQANTAP